MFSGSVLHFSDLIRNVKARDIHTGKLNYAVVRREWVEWYYKQFRDEIGKGQFGVIKWDKLFTCTAFTTRFVADAQLHFFRNAWHDTIQYRAESVAIGEFWFQPQPTGPGHAIAVCMTENGLEFFEPQTGQWVNITEEQRTRNWFAKFD